MGSSTVVEADFRQQIDEAHERLQAEADEQGTHFADPDELREEAGDATGDVEAQQRATKPALEPLPVEDLRVDGTTQLGLFDAGGKKPTSASIRLVGGKIQLVDGKAFRKGDRIHFEGVAVIREVAQQDKRDSKTGLVVAAEQKHQALITDLVISPAGADGEDS